MSVDDNAPCAGVNGAGDETVCRMCLADANVVHAFIAFDVAGSMALAAEARGIKQRDGEHVAEVCRPARIAQAEMQSLRACAHQ